MKYNIIKLFFTTPLHLSRGQTQYYDKSESVLHSDTIKSAIFSCARMILQNKINKDFLESFTISSAFPFIDNEYFFPKPLSDFNPLIEGTDEGPKTHKKLKKIEFLTKNVYESFIAGKLSKIKQEQICDTDKYVFSTKQNIKEIYKSEVQQRLLMPDDTEKNPKPFYLDRIFFKEGAGLFFIINYKNVEAKEIIYKSLKLLESSGFGTDRNVGNGHFSFSPEEIDIAIPKNATMLTNLSLYLPEKSEIENSLNENSKYKLIKRGGYISSPENEDFLSFRKKSVYMFKEGSVFKNTGQIGKIIDLSPEVEKLNHPIYRDGTSIFIPLLLENN